MTLTLSIRKVVSLVESTIREQGREVDGERRKVACGLVMHNPYAGQYVEDLADLVGPQEERRSGRGSRNEALAVPRPARRGCVGLRQGGDRRIGR